VSAPDFVAPILGFRAWRPEWDGALTPWSAGAAGAWVRGVNQAVCLHGRDHVPPGRDCTCGIYALADWKDYRLHHRDQVVGAIAAWGEVEVHRTGFRAQYACILALSLPEGGSAGMRDRLDAAAERYAVPLVPLEVLEGFGHEYAQPLAFDAIPRSRPAPPPEPNPGPPLTREGVRGIACEDHLWLRITGGAVRVGITHELAGEVQIGSPVSVVEAALGAGDQLAMVGAGDAALRLAAPFSAFSVEPNPALAADPDLVRTDPEGEGWLARVVPSKWGTEGGSMVWGAPAARVYRSTLAREREDPFHGVRVRWLRAYAHVTSAGAVLEELRAARAKPRFASPDEFRRRVVERLQRALGRPEVRDRVTRAGVRVLWEVSRPQAQVLLDLHTAEAAAVEQAEADVVLSASAETADDYFLGRLDLAAALRRGDVACSRPVGEVLALESIIKALHRGYALS
jgi:glycine cleavage system H lipoate-binding protein